MTHSFIQYLPFQVLEPEKVKVMDLLSSKKPVHLEARGPWRRPETRAWIFVSAHFLALRLGRLGSSPVKRRNDRPNLSCSEDLGEDRFGKHSTLPVLKKGSSDHCCCHWDCNKPEGVLMVQWKINAHTF